MSQVPSSLTKEQKLAKLDAIREKKRRVLASKPVYIPNAGQLEVHKDPKKIRIVAAGNGGGKTALAVQEAIWAATGYNPIQDTFTKVPATVVLLLDSPMKIDQVWLPELRKWYPLDDECQLIKHGKPYVNEIRFKNGSQILVMLHEQDEMVFESIQLDALIADEPFPRFIWIALGRGQRKKGSKPWSLLVGTPLSRHGPWLYQELWQAALKGERDDIGLHRYRTEVNAANLADDYIESYGKNLTEKEKAIRFGGNFEHLDGLALAHLFDRSQHVVEPFPWPRGKPAVLIVDPHFSKPHRYVLMGATGNGRIYVIKEGESKSPARRFAAELKDAIKGEWRIIDYIIDSLGETPNTGGEGNTSFAEVLRLSGLPFRSTDFDDKNDESFIQNIQQVLEIPDQPDNFGRKQPKLAIFKDCVRTINDIETCQWQKYRQHDVYKPKLDISNKDFLACVKYGLKSNIGLVAEVGKMPRVMRQRRSPWSGRK